MNIRLYNKVVHARAFSANGRGVTLCGAEYSTAINNDTSDAVDCMMCMVRKARWSSWLP